MDNLLQEALGAYSFEDPDVVFLRHNENRTYKVKDRERSYVLRIHQPVEGYSLGILAACGHPLDYIHSEMRMLEHLHPTSGLPLQQPVRNRQGQRVTKLADGTPVTVMLWIEGFPLSEMDMTPEIAGAIGEAVAGLHLAAKPIELGDEGDFRLPGDSEPLHRYAYTQELLTRTRKELCAAERIGHIASRYLPILVQAVTVIGKRMNELEVIPGSRGYIHADLSRSNLILTLDRQVAPIDFSLSGIGYYWMDIGMLLTAFEDKAIRNRIKGAYEKAMDCTIPTDYIEAFFAFGVILYIACQHPKVSREDWFGKALDRWCSSIFAPLVQGKAFVL